MAARSTSGGRLPAWARDLIRATGLLGPAFRLLEWRRAMTFPRPPTRAPDGLPLPGRLLMMRIGNTSDWRQFYEGGGSASRHLLDLARAYGADPAGFRSVLDWGCGCGRIARHIVHQLPEGARLLGRDIDRLGVDWCRRHLPGDYRTSWLDPPLDLAASSVDFAYGYSVLTHLTGERQRLWFEELGRVLKPGALAILTFHEPTYVTAAQSRIRRETAGVAVTEWTLEGSNLVASFQGVDSIEAAASPWFELAGWKGGADSPFDQSVAVLRRRR
jgi:SAM-dependent methyltransferase